MKLDPDCVRDVLLTVESHSTYHKGVDPQAFHEDGLDVKYGTEKLLYHIREVSDAGLVIGFKAFIGGGFLIKDLSPEGHDFLADIRSETNWKKTKEVASKVGSTSMKALITIASSVISSVINKSLGLD